MPQKYSRFFFHYNPDKLIDELIFFLFISVLTCTFICRNIFYMYVSDLSIFTKKNNLNIK